MESSGVKSYLERGSVEGRVGYAWAMQAEVFAAAGLYQHGVVGGGDTMLFLGALGLTNVDADRIETLKPHDFVYQLGPAMLSHYQAWGARFLAASVGDVGYADLKIAGLQHGARRDRRYRARQALLVGFDPAREVACTNDGPLVWTSSGERLREPVIDYFRARNEDGAAQLARAG